MIPKGCKRLAEVDFPIAEVSRHAVQEKSVRHGLPSGLHLWWARRPLASSRAMLLGLLWPDPCDPQCPEGFRRKARNLLPQVQGKVGMSNEDLRNSLLKFIGDFANWDLAANASYLEVSRALVAAAQGEEPPLIVDTFAGGGSIPLEALRLDCEAFASDLNPVACLILKVMLEEIPRHGPKLIEELRRVGAEIDRKVKIELGDLYPKDSDKAVPIAYLWARTVRCESPNCGAEIPLMRSFWLCKKTDRRRALRHRVVRRTSAAPSIEFEVFEPKTEKEVTRGTVRRARATCLACSAVLSPERVRAQIVEQNGGADAIFDSAGHRVGGARMLAVAMLRPGERGRQYRVPEARDYVAVRKAQERVATILKKWEQHGKQGFCPFPDEPLQRVPVPFGVINVWVYGMLRWGDMFTARQKVALLSLVQAVQRIEQVELRETLALVISKLSEIACAVCAWEPIAECPRHIFGRQAIGMAWDFGEGVLNSSSSGSFIVTLENAASALEALTPLKRGCAPQVADAAKHPLPDQAAKVWFVDPPYYDSVPYSYISDFFYVWIKRTLGWVSPNSNPRELTPKSAEIVAYTQEGNETTSAYAHYEGRMSQAFSEGMRNPSVGRNRFSGVCA